MKLTYKIPENKDDITLEQYLKIQNLYKVAEENEIEVNEKELVGICLGLKTELVYKLPKSEYDLAVENIAKALKDEPVLKMRFNYRGYEFGFIPDLENITAGEFSALDQFLKDSNKHAYNIVNVLYRRVKEEKKYFNWWSKKEVKKYLIEPYNSDVDVSFFKDVPYSVYESALVFFYNLGNDLQNATLNYIQEIQETTEAETLERSGDGIKHLTHILKQQEFQSTKYTRNLQVRYS